VKPACNFIPADTVPSPWVSPTPSGRTTPNTISASCLYLYLPYLHFDTYCNIIRRRKLIQRRLAHGRASPVPEDIASLESLELRVVWEYLGFDPPLNCRRTLDQFGYPSLRDTNFRDDDQMLYKLTKQDPSRLLNKQFRNYAGHSPNGRSWHLTGVVPGGDANSGSEGDPEFETEANLRDGNLLMVDQLWLWAIDTSTFYPQCRALEFRVLNTYLTSCSYPSHFLPQTRVVTERRDSLPTRGSAK
jgi:hypothetical protein